MADTTPQPPTQTEAGTTLPAPTMIEIGAPIPASTVKECGMTPEEPTDREQKRSLQRSKVTGFGVVVEKAGDSTAECHGHGYPPHIGQSSVEWSPLTLICGWNIDQAWPYFYR